jgi:hypothetical protein
MAKLRLIHTRTSPSVVYLTDVDSGLSNESMPARLLKQDVYIPFNLTNLVGTGPVLRVMDPTTPGFVDLVLSDKVVLSYDRGVIRSHVDNGLLQDVLLPEGFDDTVTVATATHDTDTDATSAVDDGLITITGTNFVSTAPFHTSVTIVAGTVSQTFTQDAIVLGGGTVTATQITIPVAVHGLATDGTEDATSVTVSANAQNVTLAVTVI